jgi:hypothetical protein
MSQDLKFEDYEEVTLLQHANSLRNRYSEIHRVTYLIYLVISALLYSQVIKLYFYCCKRLNLFGKSQDNVNIELLPNWKQISI